MDKMPDTNRYEVVLCYPDTLEPYHTFSKDVPMEIAKGIIRGLLEKGYSFDELSIINLETKRHASYRL